MRLATKVIKCKIEMFFYVFDSLILQFKPKHYRKWKNPMDQLSKMVCTSKLLIYFQRHTHVSAEKLGQLLSMVEKDLMPTVFFLQDGVSAKDKLVPTLHYLATGDGQNM